MVFASCFRVRVYMCTWNRCVYYYCLFIIYNNIGCTFFFFHHRVPAARVRAKKPREILFNYYLTLCVVFVRARKGEANVFISVFFFFAFSRRPWRMFRLANRQRSLFTHAHTLVARASPYTYKHILRSRDTTRAREGKKQTSFLEHYRRRFPIILVSHTARIRVVAACPI